jgi:hypothetical protein
LSGERKHLAGEFGWRRLSDLLTELDFLLVQLITFHQGTGPHLIRDQRARLSALHRRLDRLERDLRRRAEELGEDSHGTLEDIRRSLGDVAKRDYGGPERRR